MSGELTGARLMAVLRREAREWRRPWKLLALCVGLSWLLWGAFTQQAPDWDVPVSLIMAGTTYLTAGWSMRMLVQRHWRWWPLVVLFTWLCVDGFYAAYWSVQDPQALAWMRDANAPASLALYLACGLVWYPRTRLNGVWRLWQVSWLRWRRQAHPPSAR